MQIQFTSILRGLIVAILFAMNTAIGCLFLYPFALGRFLIPIRSIRKFCIRMMIHIAQNWISMNSFIINMTQRIHWEVQGLNGLSPNKTYLIISNHQSWMDIVILQHVLNRKIPFIRFFLKQELLYVPFLGWAWWALDFPFMKRHSKEFLSQNPERKIDDYESTLRACKKFHGNTVSILNFLEGTRFTEQKHQDQNSPYKHLLSPKSGGLAFVLNAMGDQFDSILDVTIRYPLGVKTMWETFSGQLRHVQVIVKKLEIPKNLIRGNYFEDPQYKNALQEWINNIWREKDITLHQMQSIE